MLLRGDHKSERSALNAEVLEKSIDKEVERGWTLPLIIDSNFLIKNVGVEPLGVAEQLSIKKKGERYTKICITHDYYFPGHSRISVNNQVLKYTLQPCFYGF